MVRTKLLPSADVMVEPMSFSGTGTKPCVPTSIVARLPAYPNGNVNTARARKCDSAVDRLTTIENLGVYAKAKMNIELHAPVDAMARSPRLPSFVSVSPSVKIF